VQVRQLANGVEIAGRLIGALGMEGEKMKEK